MNNLLTDIYQPANPTRAAALSAQVQGQNKNLRSMPPHCRS